MDNLFIDLKNEKRSFAALPGVAIIGGLPGKENRIRQTFDSCNFSFLLAGSGEYCYRGRSFRIEAPCVLTQWPGEPMDYGPDGTWDEIFFIYPAEAYRFFRECGAMDPERPFWNPAEAHSLRPLFYELRELAHEAPLPGRADRIDAVCWRAVVESIVLSQTARRLSENECKIQQVINEFRAEPAREVDLQALVRRYAMSQSTFRRGFLAATGLPPGQFLIRERLKAACKLLLTTELTLREIAARLNFNDQFHFAKLFRQHYSLPPGRFRERFRF